MTTELFLATGCHLVYPNIYESRQFADGMKAKYGVGFSTENPAVSLAFDEFGLKPKDGGVFNATSIYRPIITCASRADYAVLRRVYKITQTRNMCMDRLFRGAQADLVMAIFDYEHRGVKGRSLSLVEIRLDAKTVEAFEEKALEYTNKVEIVL